LTRGCVESYRKFLTRDFGGSGLVISCKKPPPSKASLVVGPRGLFWDRGGCSTAEPRRKTLTKADRDTTIRGNYLLAKGEDQRG